MKCSDCKHARPYEHNEKWDDTFQLKYEEEIARNEANDKQKWYSYKPFPSFFWQDIKADYEREEAKKATHITCKCMPTQVSKKMVDFCGQFVQKD